MRTFLLFLLLLAPHVSGDELDLGYREQALRFQGPGEWKRTTDPVWVLDYPLLRLRYQASGLPASDLPILTLRPGSVGPVTPGAANAENPFVAGMPVAVIRARDLIADGRPHMFETNLSGRMRTSRIDQFQYSLPAGAALSVEDLQFSSTPQASLCRTPGAGLPDATAPLRVHGPFPCGSGYATTLRGRESIAVEGDGTRARTLYLDLSARLPGLTDATTETADVIVQLKYADGLTEEQFPLLVSTHRHMVVNGKPALYAIDLDAGRRLASAELLDRGIHAQFALLRAGLSQAAAPASGEWMLPPEPSTTGQAPGEPDLGGSKWFELHADPTVRAELKAKSEAGGRTYSLSVTNGGDRVQEFSLVFPSVTVRPSRDPGDVYYLFPQQGAVISNADRRLNAGYGTGFPLQFLDVFAPSANRGLCLIVRDLTGRSKTFRLDKAGAAVTAGVEYRVRLAPGETFQAPNAQLISHTGSWREGFRRYRDWVAIWYKPAGPRPASLRSAFWARRDYPVGGTGRLFDVHRNRYTFEELIRDGEAFGGIDFIDISGWALSNKVGRVGDYPIELGGPEDLRANIALAAKAGIPTGLYFEGYLIDANSEIGRRSGREWQMVDETGQPRWWKGAPELFACPYAAEWQSYLSARTAAVARQVGAGGVYLDEFGLGDKYCYSDKHGHDPGAGTLPGEIAMARRVRAALDAAGLRQTFLYLEFMPPDAAAPLFDAAFCYNLQFAKSDLSPLRLNLWRFVFPDVRLWDMVSTGIDPRALPADEFRLSLWHGNGLWLKGHSESWYGQDLRSFIRRAHALLKEHAEAFRGAAEPLLASPHPAIFVNRFTGEKETVYTLFNASYRTVRFPFHGEERSLGPRDVDVVAVSK